jgi:hypothetical protein
MNSIVSTSHQTFRWDGDSRLLSWTISVDVIISIARECNLDADFWSPVGFRPDGFGRGCYFASAGHTRTWPTQSRVHVRVSFGTRGGPVGQPKKGHHPYNVVHSSAHLTLVARSPHYPLSTVVHVAPNLILLLIEVLVTVINLLL